MCSYDFYYSVKPIMKEVTPKEYIDYINKLSSNKVLSEEEKLKIHRKITYYVNKLNETFKNLQIESFKNNKINEDNLDETIIEFDINKNFLSCLNNLDLKEYLLEYLDIKNNKFILTTYDLYNRDEYYSKLNIDTFLNNQKLISQPIYIFCGYHDYSEENYGPWFSDDYIHSVYECIQSISISEDIEIIN